MSRWHGLKPMAISLRKKGRSLRDIEATLGIPRSTLQGWLKGVVIADRYTKSLKRRHEVALVKARALAAKAHSRNKNIRVEKAQSDIDFAFTKKTLANPKLLEAALAMLYLGEGRKRETGLGLGNSDPMIISFYVAALEKLYGIDRKSLYVSLHLRADQDESELKKVWSKAIGIPESQFRYVLRDKRTEGKPTYPNYNGVCFIGGGGVDIQRRLMYLAHVLCTST